MNKGDMILAYKILHGSLEGAQWRNFFQMADTSRLREHPLKLKKERSTLDLRLDLRMFFIQPKGSQHVEWPTRRHSHSTNDEGFQKAAGDPL